MRGEAVDGCPKLRAVVGVGQVAEFVDADVVCDVIGCADEPPVRLRVRRGEIIRGFSVFCFLIVPLSCLTSMALSYIG